MDVPISVTPCAGVWIEIPVRNATVPTGRVTPCAGVWIEILLQDAVMTSWEGHSLCGSVD